jgi:hypothetical protein
MQTKEGLKLTDILVKIHRLSLLSVTDNLNCICAIHDAGLVIVERDSQKAENDDWHTSAKSTHASAKRASEWVNKWAKDIPLGYTIPDSAPNTAYVVVNGDIVARLTDVGVAKQNIVPTGSGFCPCGQRFADCPKCS